MSVKASFKTSKLRSLYDTLRRSSENLYQSPRVREATPRAVAQERTVNWRDVLSGLQREKGRAISRKEERYLNRSLFCLQSSSRLRAALIKVVEWHWFNRAILFLIVTNCCFLVLEDPVCKCESEQCTEAELFTRTVYQGLDCSGWGALNQFLQIAEYIFTGLFTVEMVVKIVARGLILHKHAYLRDGWNWIDFLVVVASLISPFTSGSSIQVLRTVRVLRPLRTMTRIKGMRPLINTILRSFKALGSIVSLLSFFFIVYGILGIDLLSQGLRGKCYVDPREGVNSFSDAALSRLLSQQTPFLAQPTTNIGGWDADSMVCSVDFAGSWVGGRGCDPYVIDGVAYNTTCSKYKWCENDWCKNDWNPNPFQMGAGHFSYDNIGSAFLCIFQTLSNEGWVDLLYMYQDGWQVWGSRLFHSSWVVVGSFFVIQLALAVLADSFVQAQEAERSETEREALHNEAILCPKKVDNQALMGVGSFKGLQVLSKASFHITKLRQKLPSETFSTNVRKLQQKHPILDKCVAAGKYAWGQTRHFCRIVVNSQYFSNFILLAIMTNTIAIALDQHDQDLFEHEICRRRCDLDPWLPAEASEHCRGPLFQRTFVSDGLGGGERPRQNEFCYLMDDAEIAFEANTKYYGSNCSSFQTKNDCEGSMTEKGMSCAWAKKASGEEACGLGLYSPLSFSEEAELGWNGEKKSISLRHICGDELGGCALFSPQMNEVLDMVNEVLTSIFIAEMVLKWIGLGIFGYFSDKWNRLDCFIVMASVLELSVAAGSGGGGSTNSTLSALRGMRLFRLFKLARSWASMRQILHTLAIALTSLGPLAIVWIMFMYIFALLSMQFFGGRFHHVKNDFPRSNFDTFQPSKLGHGAFLVVFQIISTENWNTVMYNSITSREDNHPATTLLSISIVMFGNYIIMNLFISILLQGFADEDQEDSEDAPTGNKSPANRIMKGFRKLMGDMSPPGSVRPVDVLGSFRRKGSGTLDALGRSFKESAPSILLPPPPPPVTQASIIADYGGDSEDLMHRQLQSGEGPKTFFFLTSRNPFRKLLAKVVYHPIFENFVLVCILVTTVTLILERPDDTIIRDACPDPPNFLNCSGLPPGQTREINCARDAKDPDFGKVWESCDSKNSDMVPPCCSIKFRIELFQQMDVIFTLIFTFEMVLKMLVEGLVLHDGAYLRNGWNVLDFFIVIVSLVSVFGDAATLKSLKALRAIRALRPLRVIKRNPGLKVAVVCLIASIPAMVNIMVVVFVWFSMYAMLGVQIFKGGMYSCYDLQNQLFYGTSFFPTGFLYTPSPPLGGPGSVPTIVECVNAGNQGGLGSWEGKPYSFDTYPQGLLTLFAMSTTEGWLDVMAACVDIVAPGVTPIPNTNPWFALYCALHIVIGAFVLLNLIVGSVINNYYKIKNANDNIAPFMTQEQQDWREVRRLIMHLKPQRRMIGPKSGMRKYAFGLVTHRVFEVFITTAILCNVVVMAMKRHDQSQCFAAGLFWANLVFSCIYFVEAVLKNIGLGVRWYFRDPWNRFDFSLVVLSISTVTLDVLNREYYCGDEEIEPSVNFPGLSVLRVFRIARIFRLIRRLRSLRTMVETLLTSLPSLANISALLALVITIFAVLGVTFFYNVSLDQDRYGRMDENCNYRQFDTALWALHRQTTGEAWEGIMYYCSSTEVYLACDKKYGDYLGDGCGGPALGVGYHVLWQLVGTYVVMQLFTAVILENFNERAKGEISAVSVDALNEFVDAWTLLDPKAKQWIPAEKLSDLICNLHPPLGLKTKPLTRGAVLNVIKDLNIPIKKNRIQYHDTFIACVRRVHAHISGFDDEDFDDDEEFEKEKVKINLQQTQHHFDFRDWRAKSTTRSGRTRSVESQMSDVEVTFRGQNVTASQEYSARLLQGMYREWRERRIQALKAVHKTELIPLPQDFLTVVPD